MNEKMHFMYKEKGSIRRHRWVELHLPFQMFESLCVSYKVTEKWAGKVDPTVESLDVNQVFFVTFEQTIDEQCQ